METDREVVLVLGILKHHVETVPLPGRGQHETAILEEMTGITEFWPLDVAERTREVVLPCKPRIGIRLFRGNHHRHGQDGEEGEKK